MRRIATATRAINLFGAGKDGYKGGNPATNDSATQLSADAFNAIQEEICGVIESAGIVLNANSHTQLRDAIIAMIVSGGGTGSLKRSYTLDSGAILREYGNQMTATVGHFAIGITYNCAVNQATGVWLGRDIAGICWIEKINETAGIKEYWFAPAEAAGVVPVWVLVSSLNSSTGIMSLPSTPTTAVGGEVITADYVRAQLDGAGKNANGLRVRRLLPAGTDIFSGAYFEGLDAEYDATGSPNMPANGLTWVEVEISRHSHDTITGLPAGGYVFAKVILSDMYTNRQWQCRVITNVVAGVYVYTILPWEAIGGAAGAATPISRVDCSTTKSAGVWYTAGLRNRLINYTVLSGNMPTIGVRIALPGGGTQDIWGGSGCVTALVGAGESYQCLSYGGAVYTTLTWVETDL